MVSQTSFAFDSLDSFQKDISGIFLESPSVGICLMVSLMIRDYVFLAGCLQRWSAIFITSYQGCRLSMWLSAVAFDFDHGAEVVFVRFLHFRVSLSPLSMLYSLEEVTTCSSHLRSGDLFSTCLRKIRGYLHTSCRILLHRIYVCSVSVYLFDSLYISVCTH